MVGLWLAKHNDGNAWYHIYPFSKAKNISEFIVVRHKKTPREIPGVKWYLYTNKGLIQGFFAILVKGLKVLRKNEVDFIITFNPLPWGIAAWLLAKIWNKPISMGLIGADFHHYLLKSPIKRFLRYVLKKSEIVTVTGNDMKEYLIRNKIKRKEQIIIYPHCIDIEWFNINPDNALNTQEEVYDLISVAEFIKRKKIETIIEALFILKEKGRKLNLCLVGDGPERKKIEELVNSYNLGNNVHFIGYTTKVKEYLTRSRIYVQASYAEGFSISLAEAMVVGLVPVVTNAGSERDYITESHNGLYFQIGNASELAEKISYVLIPDNYRFLHQNVLQTRNQFHISRAIEACEEIADKLTIRN